MRLETGNVLAAKMNAHRHQWNGSICSQPQSWNCGADATFRASYCDNNLSRCFHIDVFKQSAPRFYTPDSSVTLAVQQRPTLLNDQLMVLYGGRFGAQQGIAPGDYEQTVFGFYRVKSATLDTSRAPHRLLIEPYSDGWAVFPRTHLRPPALRAVPGVAYLKQLRSKGLKDVLEEAIEAGASLPRSDQWNPEMQRRLQRAHEALPQWFQAADQALGRLPAENETPRMSFSFGNLEGSLAAQLKGIKISTVPSTTAVTTSAPAGGGRGELEVSAKATALVGNDLSTLNISEDTEPALAEPETIIASPAVELLAAPEAVAPVESESAATPEDETISVLPMPVAAVDDNPPQTFLTEAQADTYVADADRSGPIDEPPSNARNDSPTVHAVPEPGGRQLLTAQFGASLVDALSVAFITKSLVILTGAPGAGKSWIASRLLDDEARQRTVIVPVASTWRGREDLLGYVNPIDGKFEATELTHFLCNAQEAWEAGDRRIRLVIFEEFNLSQPEHWLSDLLVRLEYDPDQHADRTVRLGGKEVAGRVGRACSVVLVPSLRFAATLNNDHTVKPLSPRVLDRAALIEVASSGRAALSRAGVELTDDVEDVIDELNDLLEPRGAAFSVRSARSLQRALEAAATGSMGLSRTLDLVLTQEVLSRVRLLAGDPRDEQLLSRLQAWTQKPGCVEMTECAKRVSDWADFLSAGRDVFQA